MTGRDALTFARALLTQARAVVLSMRAVREVNALARLVQTGYTQLTDIEQEMNGLLTYRREPKVSPEHIAEIHRALFGLSVGESLAGKS